MADILKISQSVILTEEEINKTSRFLDDSICHTPITHETGKATIPPGTTDLELASNVNLCTIILKDGKPCTVKVGDTTATPFTNVRLFSYDASPSTIFISNPDTEPVKIEYVTAKW